MSDYTIDTFPKEIARYDKHGMPRCVCGCSITPGVHAIPTHLLKYYYNCPNCGGWKLTEAGKLR